MQTTGNLGLKKPEGTDYVDISDLNGNMDKLDTEVVKLASPTESGRMSAADKAKLNGVAAGANNYVHPNHTGDVTSNGDGVTAIAPGVIVNADVNAAAAIDASKIGTGIVSNAEYGYLDGVTSGIQAQLNARPLLTTTPQQTSGDITYYVRTDGNDSNNGLANTAGGAFKTIQKAVSMIPQIINHVAVINVGAGTYAEVMDLKGIAGKGTLTISASSGTNVDQVRVNGCSIRLELSNVNATTTTDDGIVIGYCSWVYLNSCACTTSSLSNFSALYNYGSKVIAASCTFSNRQYGIMTRSAGTTFSTYNAGSGNVYGLFAQESGEIGGYSTQPTGTAAQSATFSGGKINLGGGVVNPWGDNTLSQRSSMRAYIVSSQTLTGGVFTKLKFNGLVHDYQSEYSNTIYRFTAKKTGMYLLEGSLNTGDYAPAGYALVLSAWINGAREIDLGSYAKSGSSGFIYTQGSRIAKLNAGDYVELYAYAEGGSMITAANSAVLTSFAIIQIA